MAFDGFGRAAEQSLKENDGLGALAHHRQKRRESKRDRRPRDAGCLDLVVQKGAPAIALAARGKP